MSCLAKKLFCTVFAAFLFFALAVSPAWAAKNVIVMVSDGAGYNSWLAASMYQGKVGKQIYDGPDWIKLSSATYPLSVSLVPTGNLEQDKKLIYDPAKVWNVERTGEKPGDFAGYSYLKSTATDSAAAATAMATGRKTYNHAENWTNDNEPMTGESISEIAKASGKSAGVITTVYWCDATPACFGGAHNVTRDNHVQIANEMLSAPWLDVIMGAGNPEFLDDGQANIQPKTADFARVGGKRTWELLKEGRHPAGWKLIQNKEDFEKLTDGCAPVPAKLLGVPPSGKTFQEKRNHGNAPLPGEIRKPLEPFEIPLDETKPSLATMSKGAIRVLSKNPRGYFLMIEGGAVDWANHDNEPERTIEEQIDYLKAVETVVDWIERNGGWDETLLILTADHECGMLWGPDSDTVPFQPLIDRGEGKMPGMKHNATDHSNALVPIYARGDGAYLFMKSIAGKDEKAAALWNNSGEYVENTTIFTVMKAAVQHPATEARENEKR